jgi:hypothetical protein
VIAANPAFEVNIGSGAPMRTRFLPRWCLRNLATQKVPSREVFDGVDNLDLPYGTGTFAISHADQPAITCGFGSER